MDVGRVQGLRGAGTWKASSSLSTLPTVLSKACALSLDRSCDTCPSHTATLQGQPNPTLDQAHPHTPSLPLTDIENSSIDEVEEKEDVRRRPRG